MLSEKVLTNRLNKYFQEHYGEYDLTANWYPANTATCWKCDIVQLGQTITFICDAKTGKVTETQEKIDAIPFPKQIDEDIYVKNPDPHHNVIFLEK